MNQAPNLGRLLCRSKFESQQKNHEVKKLRKELCQLPLPFNSILKYQFK